MSDIETELTALKIRRQELEKRLEDIEADYKRGLSADFEEQSIQLENAEVLEGIAKATAAELEKVKKRISELNKWMFFEYTKL